MPSLNQTVLYALVPCPHNEFLVDSESHEVSKDEVPHLNKVRCAIVHSRPRWDATAKRTIPRFGNYGSMALAYPDKIILAYRLCWMLASLLKLRGVIRRYDTSFWLYATISFGTIFLLSCHAGVACDFALIQSSGDYFLEAIRSVTIDFFH
jgi:hypothetical protein